MVTEGEDVVADVLAHRDATFPRACARVWREYHVVQAEQGIGYMGLVLEYVQGCSGYPVGFQGFYQCLLAHMRAPRGIDKVGCRLHHSQLAFAYQMMRFRGVRQVETHEISRLQERVKGRVCGMVLLLKGCGQRVAVVVDDGHSRCQGSACQRLPDTTHSDDSQYFTVERMAQIVHHTKRLRGMVAQAPVELGSPPCHIVHEGKRQFGSGFDDWLGRVGDADAALAASVEVDIVEACAEVCNQLQMRCLRYHLARHTLVESGDQDVRIGKRHTQRVSAKAGKTLGGELCGKRYPHIGDKVTAFLAVLQGVERYY